MAVNKTIIDQVAMPESGAENARKPWVAPRIDDAGVRGATAKTEDFIESSSGSTKVGS